jgi:nitrite reductase/ring-hydroxylating ferredoxin subunit
VTSLAPDSGLEQRWFPLCEPRDLPAHHVHETTLLGRELALWRGAGGGINVWQNRCPHRGMRLSMGGNLGDELRCAYHGYRFADGSGRCTALPAHPGKVPPAALCVRSYPHEQYQGLIWTTLGTLPWSVPGPPPGATPSIPLYGVALNAAAGRVAQFLPRYAFRPGFALHDPERTGEHCATRGIDAFSFAALASKHGRSETVMLYLQPLDSDSSRIHARLLAHYPAESLIAVLRHHAEQLCALRALLESPA